MVQPHNFLNNEFSDSTEQNDNIQFLISPPQRITIPEIMEQEWFQKDYVPACGYETDEKIQLDDVNAAFDSIEVKP